MEGREAMAIHKDLGLAAAELIERGYLPISPWNTTVNPDLTLPLPVLMGNDIRALLECEAFTFIGKDEDLYDHKGCTLEWYAASIYRKEIVKL